MTTLTITAKRRVTLTKELLNHLGVGPGAKLEADKLRGGRIIFRVAEPVGTTAELVGCLSRTAGPKLTIDEMNKVTRRGSAEEK
jgi:antitoxin PrlF